MLSQMLEKETSIPVNYSVIQSHIRGFQIIRSEIETRRKNDECLVHEGEYTYHVETPERRRSHSGICVLQREHGRLLFEGERLQYSKKEDDDKIVETNCRCPWRSHWCQVCDDGRLRFDYSLDVDERTRKAICYLTISDDRMTLSGYYYLLPPFEDNTLNAKHGLIEFKKQ